MYTDDYNSVSSTSATPVNENPADPGLIYLVSGNSRTPFCPADLEQQEFAGQLREAYLRQAESAFDLSNVLELDDAHGWLLLDYLTTVGARCVVKNEPNARVYENVFDALMELPVKGISTASSMAYKRRLIEAAVLGYQKDAPDFAGKIMDRLRSAGLSANKNEIRRELSDLYKTVSQQALPLGDQQTLFDDVLTDVPGDEELVVPPGWTVNREGIRRAGSAGDEETGLRTILAPVVPVELLINLDNGTESVRLAWLLDQSWQERVVNRETVADARKLVSLAAHGCPVTSNNASTLVDYLADCLAVNRGRLPKRSLSNHLGWHTVGGQKCFLLGQSTIRGSSGADVQLEFDRADVGGCQVADAFYCKGSFEGWQEAIRRVCDYPCIRFVMAAAFVPPLLKLIEAANFCVDICGETSRGKTTALRLAASVWGCTDESAHSSVLVTWDATRVFIERLAGVRSDLPLIVDDTKRAKKEIVSSVIYDISSGRGRGRGTREGVQSSATWRTVLLSSGEAPATSYSNDGGARARTLELWGSPFEVADGRTATVVNQANSDVLEHFGHAGPRFIQYLTDNESQWAAWKERYAQHRGEFSQKAGDRPVAQRMAGHFAAVMLAYELAQEAGVLPAEFSDPVAPIWEILAAVPDKDPATEALRHAVAWATGHVREFWHSGLTKDEGRTPSGGFVGHWTPAFGETMGFLPNILKEVLNRAGYEEPEAILSIWRDRGWLHLSKEGKGRTRPQWRARIDGVPTWLIGIKYAALEPYLGFEDPFGKTDSNQTNSGPADLIITEVINEQPTASSGAQEAVSISAEEEKPALRPIPNNGTQPRDPGLMKVGINGKRSTAAGFGPAAEQRRSSAKAVSSRDGDMPMRGR